MGCLSQFIEADNGPDVVCTSCWEIVRSFNLFYVRAESAFQHFSSTIKAEIEDIKLEASIPKEEETEQQPSEQIDDKEDSTKQEVEEESSESESEDDESEHDAGGDRSGKLVFLHYPLSFVHPSTFNPLKIHYSIA